MYSTCQHQLTQITTWIRTGLAKKRGDSVIVSYERTTKSWTKLGFNWTWRQPRNHWTTFHTWRSASVELTHLGVRTNSNRQTRKNNSVMPSKLLTCIKRKLQLPSSRKEWLTRRRVAFRRTHCPSMCPQPRRSKMVWFEQDLMYPVS